MTQLKKGVNIMPQCISSPGCFNFIIKESQIYTPIRYRKKKSQSTKDKPETELRTPENGTKFLNTIGRITEQVLKNAWDLTFCPRTDPF